MRAAKLENQFHSGAWVTSDRIVQVCQLNAIGQACGQTTAKHVRGLVQSRRKRSRDNLDPAPRREDVALIAARELASLLETAHLLRSPANAERLLTALARAQARIIAPQAVDELRREVGLDA